MGKNYRVGLVTSDDSISSFSRSEFNLYLRPTIFVFVTFYVKADFKCNDGNKVSCNLLWRLIHTFILTKGNDLSLLKPVPCWIAASAHVFYIYTMYKTRVVPSTKQCLMANNKSYTRISCILCAWRGWGRLKVHPWRIALVSDREHLLADRRALGAEVSMAYNVPRMLKEIKQFSRLNTEILAKITRHCYEAILLNYGHVSPSQNTNLICCVGQSWETVLSCDMGSTQWYQ